MIELLIGTGLIALTGAIVVQQLLIHRLQIELKAVSEVTYRNHASCTMLKYWTIELASRTGNPCFEGDDV